MSRTIEVTLYKYNELEERAQERARDAARERGWYGDAWADEWRSTIDKGADALDFKVKDWSVGAYSHTYCTIEIADDDVAELAGVRAWKYLTTHYADAIEKECPFTGVMGDEQFLDPLRAFLKRPNTTSTVQDILEECAGAWARGWRDDMEFQTSDEYVAEDLEANEREFHENGTFAD
jgi:hypothetical protein